MSEFRRFTFDTDFGQFVSKTKEEEVARAEEQAAAAAAADLPPPPPTFTEEELEAARSAALEEGRQLGRAEAEGTTERMIANALNALAAGVQGLQQAQKAAAEDDLRYGLEMAVAITARALPKWVEHHGKGEIEALMEEILPDLFDERRIAVQVSPELVDPLRDRIEEIAKRHGFSGRLVVTGEAGLSHGDCRMEWADGGVERVAKRTWEEIEKIIDTHLSTPKSGRRETTGENNG